MAYVSVIWTITSEEVEGHLKTTFRHAPSYLPAEPLHEGHLRLLFDLRHFLLTLGWCTIGLVSKERTVFSLLALVDDDETAVPLIGDRPSTQKNSPRSAGLLATGMTMNKRSTVSFMNALVAFFVAVLVLLPETTAAPALGIGYAILAVAVIAVMRVEACAHGPVVICFVHWLTSGFDMYVQPTYAEGISGFLLARRGEDSLAIRPGGSHGP